MEVQAAQLPKAKGRSLLGTLCAALRRLPALGVCPLALQWRASWAESLLQRRAVQGDVLGEQLVPLEQFVLSL